MEKNIKRMKIHVVLIKLPACLVISPTDGGYEAPLISKSPIRGQI